MLPGMSKLFGTDGIRGIANHPPLDPRTVVAMGQALAEMGDAKGTTASRWVIARDTRLSGPMIEAALVAGLCSAGAEALIIGIAPTPVAARLAHRRFGCGAVVVSASHNPWEYNGLKMFSADGFKWPESLENAFEEKLRAILACEPDRTDAKNTALAVPRHIEDAAAWYIESIGQSLGKHPNLDGLHLAVDCANGAAVTVAAELFQHFGARVDLFAAAPDGRNINANCGAVYPEQLTSFARSVHADAGIAFDGDADRVVMVDERGKLLDGDHLMWILATYLRDHGKLDPPVVVGTVMTNFGLERALASRGIQLLRAPVGDRNVVGMMQETRSRLGGEPSGHIVLLDHTSTGDGLLTALAVLLVARRLGRPLSELCEGLELVPQVQTTVRVADPKSAVRSEAVQRAVEAAQKALSGQGRVVVRPSGTEPVVRVLVEGEDQQGIQSWAEEIARCIRATSSDTVGGR